MVPSESYEKEIETYPPGNEQFASGNSVSEKERIVFQPSIFRGELLVSREGIFQKVCPFLKLRSSRDVFLF